MSADLNRGLDTSNMPLELDELVPVRLTEEVKAAREAARKAAMARVDELMEGIDDL